MTNAQSKHIAKYDHYPEGIGFQRLIHSAYQGSVSFERNIEELFRDPNSSDNRPSLAGTGYVYETSSFQKRFEAFCANI